MFCRRVFGNISDGFRGISRFWGNFAGFRGNTWISRVRNPAKYQKPWLQITKACLFEILSCFPSFLLPSPGLLRPVPLHWRVFHRVITVGWEVQISHSLIVGDLWLAPKLPDMEKTYCCCCWGVLWVCIYSHHLVREFWGKDCLAHSLCGNINTLCWLHQFCRSRIDCIHIVRFEYLDLKHCWE